MSELPSVVDVAWLEGELGADDLFLGDVRGPNAHARGHIPGSRPLVLGSPPPMSDREMLEALAPEVGLRLRRHGVTGDERLVLYDRGDGMGAMPAAQMAELAGHPRVAILLGGVAAWSGELQLGQVELHPVKTSFEPRFDAVPTRDELASRLERLDADDPRRSLGRGVQRQARLSVRPAPGPHPGSASCAGAGALRRSRRAARSGSDQSTARRSAKKSLRTAIPARGPRWRRSRCAARGTARATTQARGTSGRATTTCRSKRADADTPRCADGVVSDTVS